MWTFGGYGIPLVGYLNGHGDFNFDSNNIYGQNNQLLCFDPTSEEWRNLKTLGTVHEPRFDFASTGCKVWMYGGCSVSDYVSYHNDLFQLNMVSLTWTEIQISLVKPLASCLCSLNAVTENQLLLHGGLSSTQDALDDTWVFDLLSLSWRQYLASRDHSRNGHTGNTCINSDVIIIGGESNPFDITRRVYNDVITFRLNPKSLQQMAIWTIYQHQDVLPWKLLPNQLKSLFTFPVLYARVGV